MQTDGLQALKYSSGDKWHPQVGKAIPGATPRTKWTEAVGQNERVIPKVMNGVKVSFLCLDTQRCQCFTAMNSRILSLRVSGDSADKECLLRGQTCRRGNWRWPDRAGEIRVSTALTCSNPFFRPCFGPERAFVLSFRIFRASRSEYSELHAQKLKQKLHKLVEPHFREFRAATGGPFLHQ